MDLKQLSQRDDSVVRTYEYDDETVVAADLGAQTDGSVEVVDGTAIVVREDGEQIDLDLPAGDAKAFIRNGVLTIELSEEEEL